MTDYRKVYNNFVNKILESRSKNRSDTAIAAAMFMGAAELLESMGIDKKECAILFKAATQKL